MSNDTNDPHAMNKRLYAIDEALVGGDETVKRWQVKTRRHDNFWPLDGPVSWWWTDYEYRRDPNAPDLPSWDWHKQDERVQWKAKTLRGTEVWLEGDELPDREHCVALERRPPQAWINVTRSMTRAEYEALQRLARGEVVKPDDANLTPTQRAGFKVGDEAIITVSLCGFKKGQRVTLYEDDGSLIPLWRGRNSEHKYCDDSFGAYFHLSLVRKATESGELADDGVLSGAALHRAIADAMDAGGDWWRNFQYRNSDTRKWTTCGVDHVLLYVVAQRNGEIRRKPAKPELTIDGLAQEIRRIDGSNSLGAGALAEALIPYLIAASTSGATDV